MTIPEAIAFALCCAVIIVPLAIQFVTTANEIAHEEEERKARAKYRGELNYWKDLALRSRTHIKTIGGGESEFVIENRR